MSSNKILRTCLGSIAFAITALETISMNHAPTLEIKTKRTILAIPDKRDAELMLNYYIENKAHLSKWEPQRDSAFYTAKQWQKILSVNQSLFEAGAAYKFAVMRKDKREVIGICNFNNVVHGAFQACHLGYSIGQCYEGKGYMSEALEAATAYIFDVVGLHRIMANYMPENKRSATVLYRLGFEREGLAKAYLHINGRWRDHVLTAKINPNGKVM